MPEISIKNLSNKTITTNESDKVVLKILHENAVDWMHACGGKGRCTTCKMIVIEGLENLSPHSDFEKKVNNLGALKENQRLACQCKISGDIIVKVPDENKLPHLDYSE
ncbi:MAG: 2Fe-2S iron-sulfur cluster-binding protein [Fulvivirga sp.]